MSKIANEKSPAQLKALEAEDHPPAYDFGYAALPNGPAFASASAASTSASTTCPPTVRPTNHLRLVRQDGAIKGSYLLDPALVVPPEHLPVLSEGEERRNVCLEAHNGSVNVELWVVPAPAADLEGRRKGRARATIGVRSQNGSVTVNLRSAAPPSPSHPISLSAYSHNSAVAVLIPRSFRGVVSFKTYGAVTVSDGVRGALTLFGEEARVQRGFIGALSGPRSRGAADADECACEREGAEEEEGDTDALALESFGGPLRLAYLDEDAPQGGGALARIGQLFARKKAAV